MAEVSSVPARTRWVTRLLSYSSSLTRLTRFSYLSLQGGDADAVFILENGAVLKNAIIGADQIEGVHCEGACTIQNVWWPNVCEDALSLKGNGDATIIGGGAQGADDKVGNVRRIGLPSEKLTLATCLGLRSSNTTESEPSLSMDFTPA